MVVLGYSMLHIGVLGGRGGMGYGDVLCTFGRLSKTLNRHLPPEDSSDFHDSWTELNVATRSII